MITKSAARARILIGWTAGILFLGAGALQGQGLPELGAVLNGVEERLTAGFAYKSWSAASTMVRTEYDRHGAVTKVTTARKNVRVMNGIREEDILEAKETEEGRTRDITAAFAKESKKNWDRERERRAKGDKSRSLNLDEIMPFAAKQRGLYDYTLHPAAGPDARRMAALVVKAKKKDSKYWDGTYLIDLVTYDIVKAEVRPSDNPTFVRELWAKADLIPVDGKYLFIARTIFKIDAGFLFVKNVRMLVEDSYTDVKIIK
jgi:hypothetical protein